MARKSRKCPPTVEPNQYGCVWNFSGIFDHHHDHHGRPHRKLLLDGSKVLPGAGHAKNEVRRLSFDEQLRNINIELKKKNASVNQSVKGETSSSNDNEVWKKNNVEKSFWEKIKSRYENPNRKKKNPSLVDRIVVLKPTQRLIECPVDVGCRCSYLQPRQSSTSKQQLAKLAHVSFNDVRKKLKNAKKLKTIQKTKPCEPSKGAGVEKMSLIPFSKQREPAVFVEARKHLAERLRQVVKGENEPFASSSKKTSRTLERILLSSPIHESMAAFSKSYSAGFMDTTATNDLLRSDSKFNIDATEENGRDKESQSGFSLYVSSPTTDCKSENRENPSPVSVLESCFADNVSSPTSTIESVELQIQPKCLDFEESSSQTSSSPRTKTISSSFMEDRGFISAYINATYQASELNWEGFLATDYPSESSCDHKLLHDCVKEVLIGLHSQIRFVSSKIRAFSLEKDVVDEVIKCIEWHNGQPIVLRTLDHLMRRDIAKYGEWSDVISDRNDVVFEVVDKTLHELISEAISDIHV